MARLYADKDFNLRVVEHLRLLGHDVLTVQEAGRAGESDPQVLAYATSAQRAVVTFNRSHFIRLHRNTATHSGIIVCTRDDAVAALAGRIHQAISPAASRGEQFAAGIQARETLRHHLGGRRWRITASWKALDFVSWRNNGLKGSLTAFPWKPNSSPPPPAPPPRAGATLSAPPRATSPRLPVPADR